MGMVVSYVEEITEAWCSNSGFFLVLRDVPFRIRRKGKKQFGWSDIDVIATNDDETRIINCKSWIHKRHIPRLIDDMFKAKEYVSRNNDLMCNSENLKLIFVVDNWDHKKDEKAKIEEKGIEFIELKTILEKLFVSLSKDYIKRDHYFGKETNLVSRFLVCLFFNDFVPEKIKEKVYAEYIESLKKEVKDGEVSLTSRSQMNRFFSKISINKGKHIQKYNKTEYTLSPKEKKYIISKVASRKTHKE